MRAPHALTAQTREPQDWRPFEKTLIEYCRRQGSPLRDVCGRTFLVAEFYDDSSGELLTTHYVLDLEFLARALSVEH